MTPSFSEGDIGLANMDWTKSLDDVRAAIPKEDFQQWLKDNAYLPVVQRSKKSYPRTVEFKRSESGIPDVKGGPGSGDFHHGGRPGEIGGSGPQGYDNPTSRKWEQDLKPFERLAIKQYIGYDYVNINNLARKGPESMRGWVSESIALIAKYSEALDDTIKQAPEVGSTLLYRGIDTSAFVSGDTNSDMNWNTAKGQKFVDKGFVSTSEEPSVAAESASLRQGAMLEMHIAPGITAAPVSLLASQDQTSIKEAERLLPRGLTYHVREVKPEGTPDSTRYGKQYPLLIVDVTR